MSLSAVRPYFRNILDGLGFREHQEAFTFENIGSNILDNSYHLESGEVGYLLNNLVFETQYPITVRVFKKGFRDTITMYDDIDGTADTILAAVLDTDARLGTTIKNVEVLSSNSTPLDSTNDNAIILELVFTARLELCF